MNPKFLVSFAAITAIFIVAAAWSLTSRYGDVGTGIGTDPVFPGLADKVNDISEIVVQTNAETLTIKKGEKDWVLVERDGYPVSEENVQKVLIALTEARLAEAKTKKKDSYKRIQVEDPKDKDGLSRLVELKDKAGKSVAALVVGRLNQDFGGIEGVGTYIRKPADEQSWLASGRIVVPDKVKNWVKPEFLNVTAKRLNHAVITQPDGERMEVKKTDPKSGTYQIVSLSPTTKVKYPNDVTNIGDGLEGLELEDVRATDKIKFLADKTTKTTYRTADGLIVNVELFDGGGDKFWARFTASSAPDAKATAEMDPAKEAEKINAAVKDWVYQVPAFKYRYMTRKLDDVIEKPEAKN